MKKLVTLLAAAGMVVASTAPATAADVKLDGFYRYSFDNNSDVTGHNQFRAAQRMRLGLTITASENLKGYTQFQLGTRDWGTKPDIMPNKHGAYNVQTRQMYIDWKVPGAPAKVRMGRASFGLPADAFGGNSVLSAAWGPNDGVQANVKLTDWADVTALWVRAAAAGFEDWDIDRSQEADIIGLAANLKFNGFSVAPWVAFSSMDAGLIADSNVSTDAGVLDEAFGSDSFYFGATATLTAFDPFKLVVAGAYGSREYNGSFTDEDGDVIDSSEVSNRKGWNLQAKASYKLGFGTPIVAAWYASGDDAHDEIKGGWMPSINGYTIPTTNFHDGATSLAGLNGYAAHNLSGSWGLQAGIEGMSFLEGLTHTAKVTYIQGTNNVEVARDAWDADVEEGLGDPLYLTTSDSVVELSFDSDYEIYKNLVATLELAYLINDYDTSIEGRSELTENAWRTALTFTYKF